MRPGKSFREALHAFVSPRYPLQSSRFAFWYGRESVNIACRTVAMGIRLGKLGCFAPWPRHGVLWEGDEVDADKQIAVRSWRSVINVPSSRPSIANRRTYAILFFR